MCRVTVLEWFTLYQVKRSEDEIENIMKKNNSKADETTFLLIIEIFYLFVLSDFIELVNPP